MRPSARTTKSKPIVAPVRSALRRRMPETQGQEEPVINSPHVKSSGPGRALDGTEVYVVTTTIALAPEDPGFDPVAYDDLVAAVKAHLAENPRLPQRVNIVRVES